MRTGKKTWKILADTASIRSSADVEAIADNLLISLPTAQLLYQRGCTTPQKAADFLAKRTELLYDPFLLTDMREAAQTLLKAVEDHRSIAVFGDYDVDGVTAVSSLYLYLTSLGASIRYYIPSRTGEGYGMSVNSVRMLAEEGVEVIVTVDTGVTAVEEAKLCRELGVTLIVTDHHECSSDLPVAAAVVNPHRPGDPYPFKYLAGVGVVFKLLCAMESLRDPERGMAAAVSRISSEYLDFVALGTIADVMPVLDENRLIVAYGLQCLARTKHVGLSALISVARGETKNGGAKQITAGFIGFTISPRLNAAGRIGDASLAADLLISDDEREAERLARRLCDMNRERQNEENRILNAAYARIDSDRDFTQEPVIILHDEAWRHGVIGIVASRLTEQYGCPTVMISFAPASGAADADRTPQPDDIGKGSGRSIEGMNLVQALSSCSARLEKFGGHERAAGLTIRRSELPAFERELTAYARECFAGGIPSAVLTADCELTADEMTLAQAEEINRLEPFGEGNAVPLFYTASVTVEEVTGVKGGEHVRFRLMKDNVGIIAMFFRHRLADVNVFPGDRIDILYNLDINEFRDRRTVQCILRDYRLAADIEETETAEKDRYDTVCSAMESGGPLSTGLLNEVAPTRSDCAEVYKLLRKELQMGHEVFSIRALRNLLRMNRCEPSYGKLRLILRVFSELRFLGVELVDEEREVYSFRLLETHGKTDLSVSDVMKKLRSCAQDN